MVKVKDSKTWIKHIDFILIDIVCLQIGFVLGFLFVHGYKNPYGWETYRYQAMILTVSQIVIILFTDNYSGILRRKKFDELVAVIKYIVGVLIFSLVCLFVFKTSEIASRLQFGTTMVSFIPISFCFRQLNKMRIYHYHLDDSNKRSLILVTGKDCVVNAMEKLSDPEYYHDYFVSKIILLDAEQGLELDGIDVPIIPMGEDAVRLIAHSWVDEVFILQPDTITFPTSLLDSLMGMGITVSYTVTSLNDGRWPVSGVRRIGPYMVITDSVLQASPGQLMVKRLMDIIGGLVGCILTGILFVFVAPIIYKKSPGPIFFKQKRIGLNGRPFVMHKFRTMYPDAEDRKQALMSKNRVSGDLMFKLDDDPRIIGSEKKDRKGRPAGIGNFLRNTSLDEFPQFYDILVGKMSLVGWRPCTLSEWDKYKRRHRIRATMKPGLTGMWQVSGRSEITDFDEVCRLDKEYMDNWSLWLDIKIILKTFLVVLMRKGAR
ncbi:MAG: sugar transferase [Lachnospiraceae bacterium]|nr:sugar transferase [Lachnospiraceae bacterium]